MCVSGNSCMLPPTLTRWQNLSCFIPTFLHPSAEYFKATCLLEYACLKTRVPGNEYLWSLFFNPIWGKEIIVYGGSEGATWCQEKFYFPRWFSHAFWQCRTIERSQLLNSWNSATPGKAVKKSNWSLEKLLAHTEGRGRNGFPVDSGLASRSSPGWQGVSGQSPRRLPASACHTAWDLKTVSAGPCSPWLPAYHIVDFFFFFKSESVFHISPTVLLCILGWVAKPVYIQIFLSSKTGP